MKTFYLAGKLDTGEGLIGDFSAELEGRGHTVIEKWFLESQLPKPYLSHPRSSSLAAASMIKAAADCDAFILFPTDDILGAAVELGVALGSTLTNPDKIVAIVSPFEIRQSVFYAHPAVTAVRGLAELRQSDWY